MPELLKKTFRNTAFWQGVADQMPFGILISEPPGTRILVINREACRIFGIAAVAPGECVDFREVFFGAGGKCFYASKDVLREDSFSSGFFGKNCYVARAFDVQIQQPGGQKRYMSVTSSSITDSNRNPIAMISIVEDINARKENEIKIRRDLKRLEYALNAAVDGLWEWDIPKDSGYLSPRYHQIYGFENNDLPGDIKFWHSMLHPDDRKEALARLVKALKSPDDNYTSTYRMKSRDGKYRWILSKAIVTRRGCDGTVEKMVGTHQDISRQVMLENHLKNANQILQQEVLHQTMHLKEANQQLETILNSSSESIWVCDGSGVILKANKAASETIGLDAEKFIGKKMISLVEDGLIDRSITVEVLATKKQVTRMQKIFKTDKDLMVTGTPVLDENGDISMVIINEVDLTTLNELKREIEDAQTKSRLFQEELNQISMLELHEQNMVATSEGMKQVVTMAMKLARMDVSNILILGASGTGKSLIAKFMHNNGPRKNKPFLQINCAALPESLLEAELFGYEKGAFTGAQDKGKIGLFELAEDGTIFLDEIGELSLNVQAKILKCIEEKEIMHLGGLGVIKIHCNIITATNVDLVQKVHEKTFREDLFYRINIFSITIPSLKTRSEDIIELSLMFLRKYNEKYGMNKKFSQDCLHRLQQHDFPGNVRELKNRIQKAVVITDNELITDLIELSSAPVESKNSGKVASFPAGSVGLAEMVDQFEKNILLEAARKCSSSRRLAALLKTSQSTVVRRFRKHGLTHMLTRDRTV